jgi:hypothetical protein
MGVNAKMRCREGISRRDLVRVRRSGVMIPSIKSILLGRLGAGSTALTLFVVARVRTSEWLVLAPSSALERLQRRKFLLKLL